MKGIIIGAILGLLIISGIVISQSTGNSSLGINVSNRLDNHTIANCVIQEPMRFRYKIQEINTRDNILNYTFDVSMNGKCIQGFRKKEINYTGTTSVDAIGQDIRRRFIEAYDLNETKQTRPNLGTGGFEQ